MLRLVGNEKAKYALRGRVLAADEMSLLIDQSPGASFVKPTSKKPSKPPRAAPAEGGLPVGTLAALTGPSGKPGLGQPRLCPKVASAGANRVKGPHGAAIGLRGPL